MDNISHRYSNEDTATSMYFDAESTMSTACYKTLDAMSDTSNISVNMNDSTGSNLMNKTLENVSSMVTVKKKIETSDVKLTTPLRALPNNILKEYKALCSTPSKDKSLKTVELARGSDINGCVDLGLAFLGIEDGKPAFFPSPNYGTHEGNKEILPDIEEVSSMSTCSSVEATTSVIEGKMISISEVGIIPDVESVNDIKIAENIDKFKNPYDKLSEKSSFVIPPDLSTYEENKENVLPDIKEVPSFSTSVETTAVIERKMCSMSNVGYSADAEFVDDIKITQNIGQFINPHDKLSEKSTFVNNGGCEIEVKKNSEGLISEKKDVQFARKSNNEKCTGKQFLVEHMATKRENESEDLEIEENINPKIVGLNPRTRNSFCEPDLQTGKPSRISNSNNKRQSFLPTSKKPTTNTNDETEIPKLINKMLKITDNGNFESKEKQVNQNLKSTMPVDKRGSLMSKLDSQTSLLTSAPGNKRPFSFRQRMSVLVKTTLNSPARKIARRSALPMQRKSVLPQATTSNDASKFPKRESSLRKSMVPKHSGIKISKPNLNNLGALQGTSTKTTDASSQRKSLYPLSKTLVKDTFLQRKADILYTCNVCKDKFRVKSLLDAHKRSHESDNSPPLFIKKPAAVKQPLKSGVLFGSTNQCKYCDKKFALTKALHIHLLQNCLKIPPLEKRKLEYTDLNHVEKAQLPHVFPNHNLQSNAFGMVSTASERFRYETNKTKNITQTSSTESLVDKKDKMTDFKSNLNGNNSTASQTTSHKIKKMSAHAGVYRTPSKAVPCHLCKLTFKSILDYTNHNLASHGNNKSSSVNDLGKDVEKHNFENNA